MTNVAYPRDELTAAQAAAGLAHAAEAAALNEADAVAAYETGHVPEAG